jgi:AcrR family transcriptional regulator
LSERSKYHHGDLRAALINAAVEIITEAGIEGFSLRAAARRAGVAPSAPTHHFGSARGLLTEVAVEGYRRMGAYLGAAARDGGTAGDLPEISQAYVKFALENPGLFRLMFRNDLVDRSNDDYRETSVSAMQPLALAAEDHCKATGKSGPEGIFAIWSAIHGAAHLVLEEKAHLLFGLSSSGELVKSHLLRIMASFSGK